jgi:hypothetical protein
MLEKARSATLTKENIAILNFQTVTTKVTKEKDPPD